MRRLVGIAGVAGSGKDTLFSLVRQELSKEGYSVFRIALADALKQDINEFLIDKFGISSFTADQDTKKLIRPLLVAYGKVRRIQSKGTFWTNVAQTSIDDLLKSNEKNIVIVTDIRYDEYENDELEWLQKKNRGLLVHVSRLKEDLTLVQPANEEEASNDPRMREKSDYNFTWKTYLPQGNIGQEQIQYAQQVVHLLKNG